MLTRFILTNYVVLQLRFYTKLVLMINLTSYFFRLFGTRFLIINLPLFYSQEVDISRDGVTQLPAFTSSFQIKDCISVHIKSKSFEELKSLSRINLINIKNVTLDEHSFSWNDSTIYETYATNGIEIRVENSTVSNLPTYVFRGRIDQITFSNVHFGIIRSYAFTSLAGTKIILFVNCEFLLVENQAFKKFIVDDMFGVIGGHFVTTVPSRAIMDVTVRNEFKIKGVTFDRIRSSAIRVRGPEKFHLQNCYVSHMEGEAFVVLTRGPVFVDDNVFHTLETGALVGFNVEKHELDMTGQQEFIFKNNTITDIKHASLLFNINSFTPQLDWIYLNTQCDCRALHKWLTELIIYSHRYPQEKITPNIKLDEILLCRNEGQYMRLKDYSRDSCGEQTQSIQIVAFVSVMIVLVLFAFLVFCWIWSRTKNARWIGVPTSSSPVHGTSSRCVNVVTHTAEQPSPCYEEPSTSHRTIREDGQHYKDTELHVIVECSEPTLYANPFRERTQIYSNRCIELGREYANRKITNRHQLLTSDL